MCNVAIFLAFGATWVGMGGIIMYLSYRIDNKFVERELNEKV